MCTETCMYVNLLARTHLYTIDTVHFSSSLMEIDEALSLDRERVCEKKSQMTEEKKANTFQCDVFVCVCVCTVTVSFWANLFFK